MTFDEMAMAIVNDLAPTTRRESWWSTVGPYEIIADHLRKEIGGLNQAAKDRPECPHKHGTPQAVLWRQMQDAIDAKRRAELMLAEYEASKLAAEMTIAAMADAIAKLETEGWKDKA